MIPDTSECLYLCSNGLTHASEEMEILDGPLRSKSLGNVCQGFSMVYVSSSNFMTIKYITKSSNFSGFFDGHYSVDPEGGQYPVLFFCPEFVTCACGSLWDCWHKVEPVFYQIMTERGCDPEAPSADEMHVLLCYGCIDPSCLVRRIQSKLTTSS